jgi:hypothetical protein
MVKHVLSVHISDEVMLTGVIRECNIKTMSSNVSSSIDDTFTKIISPHKNTLFRVYKTLCTASLYDGANN